MAFGQESLELYTFYPGYLLVSKTTTKMEWITLRLRAHVSFPMNSPRSFLGSA